MLPAARAARVDVMQALRSESRPSTRRKVTAGGAAYSWPRFDVFGSYVAFVAGTEAHAGRVFTVGISWPFERARTP
ncbi:MAG: hypothetical protein A3H97_22595 [Acidobacteria bacterium RIFCSPLOWO2_02_FULL_65_29]|nr:MAG: hypothetical protein A3H97_22595 [Acidobacteria bacterium RIFCSPLOWO2_02_FULL_65_29]